MYDLLYPRICVSCGTVGSYLCSQCVNKLQPQQERVCPVCSKGSITGMTHSRCIKSWGMDGLVSGLEYQGVTKQLIALLKYQLVTDVRYLIKDICESVVDWHMLPNRNWVIIPVPLHSSRYNWRGFNQAELLGSVLAESFGWQVNSQLVRRIKATKPQMSLSGQSRQSNVSGVFSLGKGKAVEKFTDYLVVDDVWTTGATMKQVGLVLKRAGAKSVWGFALAS